MRSCAPRAPTGSSTRSSVRTSSWCRSRPAARGTDATRCCARSSSTSCTPSNLIRCRSCTSAPRCGGSGPARSTPRSNTQSLAATLPVRPILQRNTPSVTTAPVAFTTSRPGWIGSVTIRSRTIPPWPSSRDGSQRSPVTPRTASRWLDSVEHVDSPPPPPPPPPPPGVSSFESNHAALRGFLCPHGVEQMINDGELAASLEPPWSPWHTIALGVLATGRWMNGDFDLALLDYTESIDAATQTQAWVPLTRMLALRAVLHMDQGDWDAAARDVNVIVDHHRHPQAGRLRHQLDDLRRGGTTLAPRLRHRGSPNGACPRHASAGARHLGHPVGVRGPASTACRHASRSVIHAEPGSSCTKSTTSSITVHDSACSTTRSTPFVSD